jgi:phosphatidylserine/phosphatidylglycerophosphate/cardiolipin synthase-like enzyme
VLAAGLFADRIHAGRYTDGRASPGSAAYDIARGERTIFDQYLMAISAAQEAIYIENQAMPIPPVAAALEEALRRGVEIAVLVPAEPEEHVRAARRNPERRALFDRVAAPRARARPCRAGPPQRRARRRQRSRTQPIGRPRYS